MIGDITVDTPPRDDPGERADDSFETFFAARYRSAVRGAYLLTYRRDAAEDIAQDVFADLLRRWETIRHRDAYLWRAITNGARQWGRKHRRQPRARPERHAALATLPRAQREAIVLRFYAGMLEREIAAATRRPVGTVKSQLRRGIAALREELQ